MQKSHSGCPRTAWCEVNMFHKNGKSPLIRTNGTIFYSISYCTLRPLYSRLEHVYSVISVIVDPLPSNTKNRWIDPFVPSAVQFFHSWAVCTYTCMYAYMYINICTCIRICEYTPGSYSWSVMSTRTYVTLYIYKHIHTILHRFRTVWLSRRVRPHQITTIQND